MMAPVANSCRQGSSGRSGGRAGRTLRWGVGALVLAATPKCVLCVLGYLALAAGAQVEMCGGPSRPAELSRLFAPFLAVGAIGTSSGKTVPRSGPAPAWAGR